MAGVYFIFSYFPSISWRFRSFSLLLRPLASFLFARLCSFFLSRFSLSVPSPLFLSLRLYPRDDGRIIQSRLFTDFPSKETHRLRAERFLFLGASAVALTFRIETGLISYSFLPTLIFSARFAFFTIYISQFLYRYFVLIFECFVF